MVVEGKGYARSSGEQQVGNLKPNKQNTDYKILLICYGEKTGGCPRGCKEGMGKKMGIKRYKLLAIK